jgi:diguanylate cyclase (GGDEF)-like protein
MRRTAASVASPARVSSKRTTPATETHESDELRRMPLRVLLIEESDADAAVIVDTLLSSGYEVITERVDAVDALRRALEEKSWDVAIADYTMPSFDGPTVLAIVREHDPYLPFIFVSGANGEEVAVAAMRTGAHDYMTKTNLTRLGPAVEREMREAAVRRARTRAEERLAYLAYHDSLTDLPNRLLLHDRLQQAIARAQRDSTTVALLLLDLDDFKRINDGLGHYAGDRTLQQVAARVRGFLREVDTVARLGGDEFAVILPATDERGAELTARRLLAEIERPLILDGQPVGVHASIGIALFPAHGATAEILLQKADASMYVAKQDRTGCSVYAAERDRHAHRRLSMIAEFRRGLEHLEFALDYQPIVELRTGALVAVEGLVRWNHPERGRLLPADFLPIAEQMDLVNALTMFVVDRALAERPQAGRHPQARVAINLSTKDLHERHLPEQIGDVLRKHGVAPSLLVLEITEDWILSEPARSSACLSRLHDMGVRLSVDDFGTGYSSLTYLRRLPIDTLKIDRSFVQGMQHGDDAIVRSTIDLAHNLGWSVVAEGVESQAMWDALVAYGCDAAQGRFIGEPRPASALRAWLAQREADQFRR